MTTVSYLISADACENMSPYINFVVEDRDNIGIDTDRMFFKAMTEADTLGGALETLLSTKINGTPVFKPHIHNIDVEYIVECALIGETEIGCMPRMETRAFSVHWRDMTSEIGDGVQVVREAADAANVRQALDYLRFANAERNERMMAP